jgi:hypothetical protein
MSDSQDSVKRRQILGRRGFIATSPDQLLQPSSRRRRLARAPSAADGGTGAAMAKGQGMDPPEAF